MLAQTGIMNERVNAVIVDGEEQPLPPYDIRHSIRSVRRIDDESLRSAEDAPLRDVVE